jgi:hypothetical protein
VPEWLWSIVVGIIVVGLVIAIRRNDYDRLKSLEQWREECSKEAAELALASRLRRAEEDLVSTRKRAHDAWNKAASVESESLREIIRLGDRLLNAIAGRRRDNE